MFHELLADVRARPQIPPRGLLVISAVLFGSTFAPAQSALDHMTPWGVVLFRFGVATAVLLPFSRRQFGSARLEPRAYARAGLVAGVINAFGFLVLSAALERTTASNAAFLSSLFVVFVPVLAAVLARAVPTPPVLAGMGLAVVGSFLLSGASLHIGTGDALAVGDALVASMHILSVGHFAPRLLAAPFNLAQLAVSAIVMVPLAIAFGIGELTFSAVLAASYCGVAQAAALGLQVRAQRSVDATSSALILLLVPVSGAALASVVLRERLGGWGMAGAALIVSAVVVAEVLPARRAARRAAEPLPTVL